MKGMLAKLQKKKTMVVPKSMLAQKEAKEKINK
jgi:hypothetical protein